MGWEATGRERTEVRNGQLRDFEVREKGREEGKKGRTRANPLDRTERNLRRLVSGSRSCRLVAEHQRRNATSLG